MEIKVLYLGVESFHLCCAHSRPDAPPGMTKSASEIVQLGTSGALGEAADDGVWKRAIRSVRRLVAVARLAAAESVLITVASDRLREMSGSEAFFEALWRTYALRPRFLSDNAEAYLTYLGANGEPGAPSGPTVVADIGAYSLRLAVGSYGRCATAASAPLGVMRLHDAFGRLGPKDEHAVTALMRLSAGPAVGLMRRSAPEKLVFSSTLARAVRHVARAWGFMDLNENVLCRVGLHALAVSIAKTPVGELPRLGLQPAHSRVLALSAAMLDALADLFEVSDVTFSNWGAPEGLAIRHLLPSNAHSEPVSSGVGSFYGLR